MKMKKPVPSSPSQRRSQVTMPSAPTDAELEKMRARRRYSSGAPPPVKPPASATKRITGFKSRKRLLDEALGG